MKTLKIDSCSFGNIVIEGKTYTDDLIILPDAEGPIFLQPIFRKIL